MVEVGGVEPPSFPATTTLSTCLARFLSRPTAYNLANRLRTRPFLLPLYRTLEGSFSTNDAGHLTVELESRRQPTYAAAYCKLLSAFNVNFPFLRSRASDMLISPSTEKSNPGHPRISFAATG